MCRPNYERSAPFLALEKSRIRFTAEHQGTHHRASSVLQEFTLSLDSRVEFLTTERISSLYEQLVAGISRRGSTFRSPPLHFNTDLSTFSYSSVGFLLIQRLIRRASFFHRSFLRSNPLFLLLLRRTAPASQGSAYQARSNSRK